MSPDVHYRLTITCFPLFGLIRFATCRAYVPKATSFWHWVHKKGWADNDDERQMTLPELLDTAGWSHAIAQWMDYTFPDDNCATELPASQSSSTPSPEPRKASGTTEVCSMPCLWLLPLDLSINLSINFVREFSFLRFSLLKLCTHNSVKHTHAKTMCVCMRACVYVFVCACVFVCSLFA